MKLVTPLADARVSGSFRVDRGDGAATEEWNVDAWPAMIGHNWGRSHARLYAWVHCNAWDNAEDLTLEAVSARVRIGPVLSPMATGVFVRWKGREWNLNAPRAARQEPRDHLAPSLGGDRRRAGHRRARRARRRDR